MRNYNQVEAHVKSLAKPIINWDTQNIRDLKRAIDELEEYSHSDEYYENIADHYNDIFEYADIDIADLPSAPIPDGVDTTGIWAVDANGMCLAGDGFPRGASIMSLAEAVRIYGSTNEIAKIQESGDDLLTTTEAAEELAKMRGVDSLSIKQINAYISRGYLPAKKFGRDWLIRYSDLEKIRDRHRGRERK